MFATDIRWAERLTRPRSKLTSGGARFTPARFHNERLVQYGVFAGCDQSFNRIRLRMVTPEKLRGLSNIVWVALIEKGR